MKIYLALLTVIACTVANVLEEDQDLLATKILGGLASKIFNRFRFNKTCDVPDICLSPKCLRTATEILIKMNTKIEPCDDFYQFACGNYIDKAQIPANKGIMTEYIAVAAKVEEQVKSIIKKERPKTDPKYLQLPYTLYKACMSTTLIETLGSQPMQDLATALGGWPVIVGHSWDSNNSWTWEDAVIKSRNLGLQADYMIKASVKVNFGDRKRYIVNLDKPSLGLRYEDWKNETLVYKYYDYMVDLAVLFGANRNTAMKELLESLTFERELFYISQSKATSKYNLRRIKQLLIAYPDVQWLDFINELLPKDLNFDKDEVINLASPGFFDGFENLLKLSNKRTIANYMMWRIHESLVPYLSEKFRNRKLKYTNDLLGNQNLGSRSNECEKIVSYRSKSSLKFPMNSLYVHKYFSNDTEEIIYDMIDNIRGTFMQMLDEVKWMDEMTKQLAKNKLRTLTAQVGYPVNLLDNKKLELFYHNLNIDSNKYFESILNINVFDKDYSFKKLRRSANYVNWFKKSLPTVTNTFYSQLYNQMLFPAGILQGYFFDMDRPMYMNYGAIGSLIGHELAHSLHDICCQYDDKGNLLGHPETSKAYLEKIKCIVEQYGNYTDKHTGLNLNGNITQNENIADNIGIRQSYLAYRKWLAISEEVSDLPGLYYTPQQMFWITAAQMQCAKYKTDYLKTSTNHLLYSPNEFRVLGPLRNIQEFSHDFQCPKGSLMNPVKKCQIW